ncbi:hypothetical protein DEO72_LG3g208 [Vigna unguiculata]|uniref:Secreted protein n=1 Tax=Vigna unguiculata TaxID=3917 RepID=A0A4D6LAW2_VIGUN|nr:hypothetical protein DEO72_LG3g208 [Vigna unguiculata]
MRGIRVCVALSTVKTVAATVPRVTETLRCVVLLFVNQFFCGHASRATRVWGGGGTRQ